MRTNGLTNKQQDFKRDVREQLTHWDNLAKELEHLDGADNQRLMQEIRQEIYNLTQAVNEANILKKKEIEVVDRYNRSNPQERAQIASKIAFEPKLLQAIPLIGERVHSID